MMKLIQEITLQGFSIAHEFTYIICNETSIAPKEMTISILPELIHQRNNGIYSMLMHMQLYPFIQVSSQDEKDMYELATLITYFLGRKFYTIIKPGTKLYDLRNEDSIYSSIQENAGSPILSLRNLISVLIGCINWENIQVAGIDKNPRELPTSVCSGRYTSNLDGFIIVNMESLKQYLDARILYFDNKSFGINSMRIQAV